MSSDFWLVFFGNYFGSFNKVKRLCVYFPNLIKIISDYARQIVGSGKTPSDLINLILNIAQNMILELWEIICLLHVRQVGFIEWWGQWGLNAILKVWNLNIWIAMIILIRPSCEWDRQGSPIEGPQNPGTMLFEHSTRPVQVVHLNRRHGPTLTIQ